MSTNILELTTAITAAFLENNRAAVSDVPEIIRSVHAALSAAETGASNEPAEPEVAKPTAAQVRKSITPDRIISFEDGRGYSSLKRHLTRIGMTPADYRAKWGLPSDYPMVAPAYSARRSELAKKLGLGQGGRKPKDNAKAPAKGRGKAKGA